MDFQAWPSQQSYIDWMEGRKYGYCGHEMGVGKTFSVLSALRNSAAILVCCPIAVASAWRKQVSHSGQDRVVCLAVDGSSAARAARIRAAVATGLPCIVVVNYESVYRGDVSKAVLGVQWDALVLDESHRIKSPTGKCSKWLAKLAASQPQAKRICMSGTPTPHSPLDWFGQFRFLDESILGQKFPAFRARIAITHPKFPGWVTGYKKDALAAMRARIDEHVHRVTADEVLSLPEAIHTELTFDLSPDARRFYDHLRDEMIARLDDGAVVTAANKMVVIGRLQQATGGFCKDTLGEIRETSGTPDKLSRLSDWLEDVEPREAVVIFCKYTADIQSVTRACVSSGRKVSELSGHRRQLEQWQAGETDVLVVQQQAGGAGVDLTRSSVCVYYSLTHSLGDYEQSLARLRRPGQHKTCRYFHLIAKDTVDEDIYEALIKKKDVVESVLGALTRRVTDDNNRHVG